MQTDAEFVAFWRAMALREQRDRLPQGPSPAEIQRSWAAAPTPAWGTTAPVDDSGMLAGLERAQATVDRHRLKHGENYRSRMGDSSGIEGIHPYLTDDIDIYLSVGTADEKGNNCKMGADGVNNRTCEIYRLRGRLSNIQAACVTRVTRMGENNGHPVGAIQPAVSPSGDRMAYMEDGKSTNRLVVQDLRGCVPYNINDRGQWSHAEGCAEYMTCYSSVVDSEEHHLENYLEDYLEEDEEDEEWKAPNFPNWYLDDWLLFTKGAGERSGHSDKTLHMAEVAGYPVRVEGSFPVAGPNGAFSQNRTFQDANTARDGSNRVVTFGQTHQNGTSSGPLEPAVHNVFGLWPGNGGGSLDPQSFHLGMQVSDRTKPVKECHHPAFSPSGKSVGCSEQQNVEFIGNSQFRFIYEYEENERNRWVQANRGLAFGDGPTARDWLPAAFRGWTNGEDVLFTYKQAEWCGTDRYMVVTLYATRPKDGVNVTLRSRVYLVDRQNASDPEMIDLTKIVADKFEIENFNGQYATCHRRSG